MTAQCKGAVSGNGALTRGLAECLPRIADMLLAICRRRLAWVLLCALVVAALAPGVARALAFAQGQLAPWAAVCTTPADVSAPGGHDAAHLMEHCAWCSLHADTLAPPPAADAVLRHLALRHAVPTLFLHAPRPLPAWAAAQARAPPVLAG